MAGLINFDPFWNDDDDEPYYEPVKPAEEAPPGFEGYCIPCGGDKGKHKLGCPVVRGKN